MNDQKSIAVIGDDVEHAPDSGSDSPLISAKELALVIQQAQQIVASQPKPSYTIQMPTLPTPQEIESINQMCKIAAYSGFVNSTSKDLTTKAADAFFVMMMGRELGIPAMMSLKTIYVIEGKPSCSGQALLSLMRRAGVAVEVPDPSTITDKATVRIKRPGGEWKEYSYTMDMAVQAGLAGRSTWLKYHREMLIWRAVSLGNRFETPDITGGLHTIEELKPDWEVDADGELTNHAALAETTPQPEKPATPKADKPAPEKPADPPPETKPESAVDSNPGGWAKTHWQVFVDLCRKTTGGWDEIIPDLVKDKGITNINDPAQWDAAFKTGKEAGEFVEAAWKAASNPTPAQPKSGVDDLLPALDEKGIEELRAHLRDDYWMLTEEEALDKLGIKDWSKYKTLLDAKAAVREAMIQTCEPVVVYKARYMGQYTDLMTVFGAIRCYGRDQIRNLSEAWATYADSWKKGKDYLFADAKREPLVAHWSWAGEGDKKYMIVDKEGGLMIHEGEPVPF